MIKKSSLFILGAAILWGCIGVFVNTLTAQGFNNGDMVLTRVTFACLGMAVYLLLFDRSGFKIRLKDIWCFIGTGLISLYMFNICYFYSIQLNGSLGVAAVLLYTAPAFVLIFSVFLFKEKLTRTKIISLILMMTGCVLVSGVIGDASYSLPGILLGLGSGLGYALYSIFGRYALNRGYRSSTITFYTFAFSILGSLITSDPVRMIKLLTLSPYNMFFGAGLGIICCVMPYVLYTKGLEKTENSIASIIATAEPMVASIIGIAFYSEKPSIATVIGIVIMITGIITMNISKGEKE